jgi:NAD(P)-dependent dehydrogenase (short-subunit alcohol dehydrogenase family)
MLRAQIVCFILFRYDPPVRQHGADLELVIYHADIADEAATRAAFSLARRELGPIAAVFHLSGVLVDEPPVGRGLYSST